MNDIEIKTSSGRMLMILGIMLGLCSLGVINEHASWMEVFRIMSSVISTLALIIFMRA
jgi:hypothetical protein